MTAIAKLTAELQNSPRSWLITGVAGFIGSNLLEALLRLNQRVVGLENFNNGHQHNLDEVRKLVTEEQWQQFEFIAGSITDAATCARAARGVELILHHAALGSVPYSIAHPEETHAVNVTGFLNVLGAARDTRVKRLVYASSSAVYGDETTLPKVESRIGKPLSPYAATKQQNEVSAADFAKAHGTESVGLRYFNVFGPRQDPEGAYAAVIPKWIDALLRRDPVRINGDGETSRDFSHVENVVQANLLAALTPDPAAVNQVYNIALGQRTTLNELFAHLQQSLRRRDPAMPETTPVHGPERAGDIRHSLADISKARELLGFSPTVSVADGLERAMDWYCANSKP
jgi:UDP-N-acetylglucosamine 4-epimerase